MNGLIGLSVLGVVNLLAGVFGLKKILPALTVVGLLAVIGLNCADWGLGQSYFNDMFIADNFALAFTNVLLGVAALLFLLAPYYFKGDNRTAPEFFALLLFSLAGAQVMVSYGHLVMLFIGIEILSLAMYVLAGSYKKDAASNEAALKYFLMGSFASCFLLLGIALVYGATGQLSTHGIADWVAANSGTPSALLIAGVLLIFAGLAFKISAVPFHAWAPDVYQGAPTVITAFMSTVVKVASVAAFSRLFSVCFGTITGEWQTVAIVIAILTMTVGNITALLQTNAKRLLAYSGIAHAGFLLIGIAVADAAAQSVLLYYAVAYSLASVVAFAVLSALEKDGSDISIFNGLVRRSPILAAAMAVAMLSFAGIPPMAGFFAKYNLIALSFKNGLWLLAIFALLNSLIAIYYYFGIMVALFTKEPCCNEPLRPSAITVAVAVFAAAAVLLLGVFPDALIGLL